MDAHAQVWIRFVAYLAAAALLITLAAVSVGAAFGQCGVTLVVGSGGVCGQQIQYAAGFTDGGEMLVQGVLPDMDYDVWRGGVLIDREHSSPDAALHLSISAGAFAITPADSILIPACADLVVSAHLHEPVNPNCGDQVRVRAEIKNIGTTSAGTSWGRILLDGEPRASWQVPDLAPGAAAWSPWVSLPADLAPGIHIVTACADYSNAVPEMDETNNCSGAVQ